MGYSCFDKDVKEGGRASVYSKDDKSCTVRSAKGGTPTSDFRKDAKDVIDYNVVKRTNKTLRQVVNTLLLSVPKRYSLINLEITCFGYLRINIRQHNMAQIILN